MKYSMLFSVLCMTLIHLLNAGCSGTRLGNPNPPGSRTDIELGPIGSSNVSSLTLCLQTIEFIPSDPAAVSSSFALGSLVSVDLVSTSLSQLELPNRDYSRVDLVLNPQCVSSKSLFLTNTHGTFSTDDSIRVSFLGTLSATGAGLRVTLQIQPIVDQLATVNVGTQLKSAAESVQGSVITSTSSTLRFVRQGATGTGTGADWESALPSLPASLMRGLTYYIADGAYAAYTVNSAPSGTDSIRIKKATASDHGSDTGWLASYGDGTATFANLTIVSTAYVEVQGLSVTNATEVHPPVSGLPSTTHHITLKDITGESLFIVAEDVLVQGGSFGGFNGCESSRPEDIVQIWEWQDTGGVYRAASRVTIDGVRIHDITDNGDACAGLPTAGRAVSCMQILSGHSIIVKNSTIYNCATAGIMARPYRDTMVDITIESNFVQEVMNPGSAVNMWATGDTIGGTNLVRYNTILGALALGSFTLASGASASVYGNILDMGFGSCLSPATFSYNVFLPSASTCGTDFVVGTPSFVGPTPAPSYLNGIVPNYRLAPGDTVAKDRGHPTLYPATDIDGGARLSGSAPDAGADEL
jgi:hypothetical protein